MDRQDDYIDLREKALAVAKERIDAARERLREESIAQASTRAALLPRPVALCVVVIVAVLAGLVFGAAVFAWGYRTGSRDREREITKFIENAADAAFQSPETPSGHPGETPSPSHETVKILKVK